MQTTLLILGSIIIIAMAAYAAHLLIALQKQKKILLNARLARVERLQESIMIIAKAMQNGDCNYSEGVIRLKMLLEPLGQKKLTEYPAMFALYQVVQDMPTHEARRELPKNQRMRLDLTRESAEAKWNESIKLELNQLLIDMSHY